MTIQGILFDYGNTLISIELDWEKVIPQNIASLISFLQSHHIPVDIEPFGKRFVQLKNESHKKGQLEMHEYKSVDVLRQTLAEYKPNHISDALLEQALEAYFDPEESLYPVVSGAYRVLEELKSKGYKLGIVSNASSAPLIYKALERRDFPRYFDTVIVSADVGYRKPHPKIFEMALENLGVSPEDAVMIGDVPAYDIAGSKPLGIKTILVKYLESTEANKAPSSVEPDEVAYQITDIPKIIESWN